MWTYMYIDMSMYMSTFRDLESGLSKDLKDGERGLRRANAGGGSWRYWPSDRSYKSNNLAACVPRDVDTRKICTHLRPLSLVSAAWCAASGLDDHLKSGFERSLSWMGGRSAVPLCWVALSILVWWQLLSAVVAALAVGGCDDLSCASVDLLCEFSRLLSASGWRWNPSVVPASAWTLFLPAAWFVPSLLCHPYMFWSFRPIGCAQKDRNCEICHRTKITRAPCRRRIGGAVPRAEHFGDLITADHKVLSEGCESRNNYRYAVVVQDLATQRIQSKVIYWQFLGIWQTLWRSFLESLYVDTTQITNIWDCWESSAQSERRYVCSIVAIRSGWKLVGRFHGMLYLSAKYYRSLIWWKPRMRDVLGNHLKDRLFHLVHWLSITL